MVDLGPYAGEVLAAYGVSGVLLAAIIARVVTRAARVRRELQEAERNA
ncbi:MAG: heme exporter protein CcmD [Pseudomonadota bacterium]